MRWQLRSRLSSRDGRRKQVAELDLLLAPGSLGRRTVIAAARAGIHQEVTWLPGSGRWPACSAEKPEVPDG